MAEPSGARPMFMWLIAFNHEAFTAGHYNTAYRLLAAALHEAEEDANGFSTVERLAEAQLAEIDARRPEYRHSTRSAAAHGQRSIFATSAMQAHTMCLLSGRP